MAYCRNCGGEIAANQSICPKCNTNQEIPAIREPIKASTGRMVAMWIFCLLGGWIGVLLAVPIITNKYPDKTHLYNESCRSQAKVALTISLIWIALAIISMLLR